MFAEPLVAAALEAAAEDAATEEAAVEVLEEPPQAVIAAVAPTTADAFRKSRREIIFIIMFSFNSYLSIFTGAILHAPVIPVRIIPLQHPTVQENKFTRLKEFFCAISTNAFWARQFLFSKHHNFSYICNLPTKAKKLCHFSLKKITKCCIVRFLQLFHFVYILKNILQIACHSRFLPPAFLQRKCPEAFLSLRAFQSEYLLQMQQHLCNVEVDQQRGGIHNGGDQG